MATIGNVSLLTLLSDLRARVNEIAPKVFDDKELIRWLNVGQQETMIRIKDFNEAWYLTPKTITIVSGDAGTDNIDLSDTDYFNTDWAKVNELHYIKAVTYIYGNTGGIPIFPIDHIYDFSQSTLHTDYSKCAQVGSSIYFTNTLSANDIFIVFYYRKPVDMSEPTDKLDVPDWTQDLVVMFAYNQCLRKIGRDTSQNDNAISTRLNEIKNVFGVDMQMDKNKKKEGTVK